MVIKELKIGNIVDYETIPYRVDSLMGEDTAIVTAMHHEWQPEKCSVSELKGYELTAELLLRNGFENDKNVPGIFIRKISGMMDIRYDSKLKIMDFRKNNMGYFHATKIPWPVSKLHQMQNACTDYGLEVEFNV